MEKQVKSKNTLLARTRAFHWRPYIVSVFLAYCTFSHAATKTDLPASLHFLFPISQEPPLLLGNVVLLLEQVTLDLCVLELLEIPVYEYVSRREQSACSLETLRAHPLSNASCPFPCSSQENLPLK